MGSAQKRAIWLLIAGVILVCGTGILLSSVLLHKDDFQRAAWLWHTSEYVDSAGLERFRRTANHWGLTTVYVECAVSAKAANEKPMLVASGLCTSSSATAFRKLATVAADDGIQLWALGGDPEWATTDSACRAEAWALIDATAAFNATFSETSPARMAGVHFDVEPYALPSWTTQRDEITRQWRDFIIEASERAHRKGLKIGFSLPAWDPNPEVNELVADEKTPGRSVRRFISDALMHADEVVVMCYRNKLTGPNSVEALSGPGLLARDQLQRDSEPFGKILIGLETEASTSATLRFLAAVEPPARTDLLPLRDDLGRRVVVSNLGRIWLLGLAAGSPGSESTKFPYAHLPATAEDLLKLAQLAHFPVTGEPEVIARASRDMRTLEDYQFMGSLELSRTNTPESADLPPVVAIEATERPHKNISFKGVAPKDFSRILGTLETLLKLKRAQGIAIHTFEELDTMAIE